MSDDVIFQTTIDLNLVLATQRARLEGLRRVTGALVCKDAELGIAEFTVVNVPQVLDVRFPGGTRIKIVMGGAAPALAVLFQVGKPFVAMTIEFVRLLATLEKA